MSDQLSDYRIIIGKNIELALKRKGKTQSWLADQLDIYASQLSTYIKGKSMANPELFQKIAESLDLSVQQLLSRKELLTGETVQDTEVYMSDNDVDDEFSITNELKAEAQTAINYAKTLKQSTSNKKIRSLANLIQNKITFVSENI